MRKVLLSLWLLVATDLAAAAPRDGANHRVGDDSFVAAFGRAPTSHDAESLRMDIHLRFVRERLVARTPTRPELARRRAEILGYLDEYIARGVTPLNGAVPLRTPVFIDDHGNICAVGYLIERATGSRALADRIAARHRFDYLEDIAAAMPDVRAWIDGSGFTVEELASIQPGYAEPDVESWVRWTARQWKNGPLARSIPYTGIVSKGHVEAGRMHGVWTSEVRGKIIGKGRLVRGNGAWTSFYQSGARLAAGRFVANDPSGTWRFFHESGNLAAEGAFARGIRHGTWHFYYDTPARTPIARGDFHRGAIVGAWSHYDAAGKLLAVSRQVAHHEMAGDYLLEVVPGPDRIRHEYHRIGGPDEHGLAAAFLGTEKLYRLDILGEMHRFDASGYRLERAADGRWHAADCKWSDKRRRIASNGDTRTLHRLLYADSSLAESQQPCGVATLPVDAARTATLDKLVAAETSIRTPTPAFVKELALGRYSGAYVDSIAGPGEPDGAFDDDPDARTRREAEAAAAEAQVADLPRVLAASLAWYIEFPHIDGRFERVFHTLPGYMRRDWEPSDEE